MTQPKEIFAKLDHCMGCHSCELACAVAHSQSKSLYAALREAHSPKRRLFVEGTDSGINVPILCRHCEEAPCLHACISGAISRTAEGVVRSDPDRCIGCWTCVMVCPYGVIGRETATRKAYKCDRCPDLEIPACVNACPTKALLYRSVDTHSAAVRKTASARIAAGE
jgi:anaerobic carbon-monoxide dehydrogenase iron sulfur subunit